MSAAAHLRICLFTPTFLPLVGGAERMADVLARGFLSRGQEVMVLYQPSKAGPPPALPYPVRPYRRPPLQHLWPASLTWAVRRAYRAWPFDVLLSFYAYPTGYAAGLMKRKLGFGLVISARGGDLYPSFHALQKPGVLRAIRRGYLGADRIVVLSRWMQGRLREIAGDNLPPMQIIYNGIDLTDLAAQSAAAKANPPMLELRKPFILHLARVAPVKQQLLAVEAIYLLREELIRRSVTYAFVGDGNDMETLRNRVREYKLESVVAILGTRVGVEKAWLLDNALFMVTTSREEGMPNTVLESLASGLPVLASDIEPHQELIESPWGCLFRNGDAHDLAAKIAAMFDQDLTPLRQAARRQGQTFSIDAMIDSYVQACEQTRPFSQRPGFTASHG